MKHVSKESVGLLCPIHLYTCPFPVCSQTTKSIHGPVQGAPLLLLDHVHREVSSNGRGLRRSWTNGGYIWLHLAMSKMLLSNKALGHAALAKRGGCLWHSMTNYDKQQAAQIDTSWLCNLFGEIEATRENRNNRTHCLSWLTMEALQGDLRLYLNTTTGTLKCSWWISSTHADRVVQQPRAKAGHVSSVNCEAMPMDCEALVAVIWASWKTWWIFESLCRHCDSWRILLLKATCRAFSV